ncbi:MULTISPECIES: hypothetical protein [unclassified Streptomyces]
MTAVPPPSLVASVRLAAHYVAFGHGERTHDHVESLVLRRLLD